MDSLPSRPLTDDEMHALVDARGSQGELATLQARLALDPAARARVENWRRQGEALKNLHRDILDEPVAAALKLAALRSAAAQQEINRWWRWGGMAASVVMTFGLGWLSHGVWQQARPDATVAAVRPGQEFARQASFAHAVYSPELRHPVEVAASEQEHLVKWLSKRVGKPLKIPNLTALGYDLVGGRLLPGDGGARAQFMFENVTGTRLTLYLGAVERTPKGPDASETGFNFSSAGPVPSFYWMDQGFGYALAGPVPREVLMKLAEAAYRQL